MRSRLCAATGAAVRDQERALQLYRIRIEEFGAGREKVRGLSRGRGSVAQLSPLMTAGAFFAKQKAPK